MAFTMTRRERTFLILTVALAAFAALYYLGLEDQLNALADQREQLRVEMETYRKFREELRRKEKVDGEYAAIERMYSINDQGSSQFTGSVESAFAAIGMARPQFRPPEEAPMEGNAELGYVKLHITCEGDVEKVVQMLNFFDKQAILVEELHLTSFLDSPRINIDVTVSQIVKVPPEKQEEWRRKGVKATRRIREREPMGL